MSYLEQIQAVETRYNKRLNPPASNQAVADLRRQAWQLNEYVVAPAYEQLLQYANGLDFNGHVLYGTYPPKRVEQERNIAFMDFYDANDLWADYGENETHLLIMYAESGLSLYVHDRIVNRYQVIDRVGSDAYFEAETFEELAGELFKDMLSTFQE